MNKNNMGVRDKDEPLVWIPETLVIAGEALTDAMIRVWLVLKRHAHYEGELLISNISVRKIGEKTGKSETQVREAIKKMVDVKLIAIEKIQRDNGFGVYNEYVLEIPRVWWKEDGQKLQSRKRKEKHEMYNGKGAENIKKARFVKDQPKIFEEVS